MTNVNLYTVQQQKVLALSPLISGIPSLVGSFLVLIIIWRDWKKKLNRVYHRLLFSYSLMDMLVTLNMIFGFLLMPKGSNWGAQGNDLTCSFQGAMLSMTFTSIIYVTSIALYYFLILCLQVTEAFIARYVEPLCHFMAIVYPVLANIGAMKRLLYSPLTANRGYCWFQDVPFGCTDDPDVSCERGKGAEAYEFVALALVSYICIPIVVTAMASIYMQVRRKLLLSSELTSNLYLMMKLRDTRNQCFLYVFAYTSVSFWSIVLENAHHFGIVPDNKTDIQILYPLVVISKLALASGGIWSTFIYMRPRFVSLRRRFPTVSAWHIHKSIILDTYQPIQSGLRRQEERALRQISPTQESFMWSTIWGTQAAGDGNSSAPEVVSEYPASDESDADDFIPEIIYIDAFNDQSNNEAATNTTVSRQDDRLPETHQSGEADAEASAEGQRSGEDSEIASDIAEGESQANESKVKLDTQSEDALESQHSSLGADDDV